MPEQRTPKLKVTGKSRAAVVDLGAAFDATIPEACGLLFRELGQETAMRQA